MSNYSYQKILYSDLLLDDENPRLPKSMQGQSEEKIIEYMLLEAATLELMQAIGENDFFAGEQLLVVKENNNDKYRVIEGNRRLTAVKLLINFELATVQKNKVKRVFDEAEYRPQNIPCLIFTNKNEILKYLGYRHVTGIKTWKLLEKARYLYLLKDSEFPNAENIDVFRELAKMIGSRRDYVQRVVVGYEIYTKIEDLGFYKIPNLNDTTFYFNYIADSLKQSKIINFLNVDFHKKNPLENLNYANLEKWTKWLFEKNSENKSRLIGDSKHLNMLNKVLGNPTALKAFDVDGISLYKAHELTYDIRDVFDTAIKKSLDYLEQANSLVHKVNEIDISSIEDLRSINKLARHIATVKEREEDDF